MCTEKHTALHAKSVEGYIAHLEKLLLNDYGYARCCHCKRVDDYFVMKDVIGSDAYVCGACEAGYRQSLKDASK